MQNLIVAMLVQVVAVLGHILAALVGMDSNFFVAMARVVSI